MSSRKPRPQEQPQEQGATFEEAVAEVEAIIDRIESGEMGLEEQIEQYARGAELLKRCREILDKCEQRVEEIAGDLKKSGAGQAGGESVG